MIGSGRLREQRLGFLPRIGRGLPALVAGIKLTQIGLVCSLKCSKF
jgi:hypothetical protein